MSIHDIYGRPWAKLSELKAGDKIELDDGFTCRIQGPAILEQDNQGLFFQCDQGTHHLDDQADDGEHCVGIYGPIKEQR